MIGSASGKEREGERERERRKKKEKTKKSLLIKRSVFYVVLNDEMELSAHGTRYAFKMLQGKTFQQNKMTGNPSPYRRE